MARTFRDAVAAVVDVGYALLHGQDDEKKREYERRAHALNAQIFFDLGVPFPGHDARLSPAAEGLLERLIALLYQ